MSEFSLQQQLAELKAVLDADPANVAAAQRYWAALAAFAGNDVRSGGYLIEAFRGCALASTDGTVAFARAYQDLFARTGEEPNSMLFDETLVRILKARLAQLPEQDRGSVQWVLTCLK